VKPSAVAAAVDSVGGMTTKYFWNTSTLQSRQMQHATAVCKNRL